MNQTLVRRLSMAMGFWSLLRYQTRLCRSSSPGGDVPDAPGAADVPRWIGKIRVGRRSQYALLCPPPSPAVYRFLAPPRSRVVAWCALLPEDPARNGVGAAEFAITVQMDGSTQELTERLRLDPERSSGDRRWRRLVLELQNRDACQIELTLTTATNGAGGQPVWGEPRLEWRRPFGETRRLLGSASRQALRGQPVAAARSLHGRLSEGSHPSLYGIWLSQQALSRERLARMRAMSESFRYRPLVSIVTPVYNTDARWLRACIESVRSQAYPFWQLCLADDGSTREETRQVLLEYQGDTRIRIHTLPENAGISAASNAALAMADGEFVAFLDHDDEISPDALFEVVAHLNERPYTDFIYSDEDKLELDGTRAGPYFKPDWSPEHFLTNMYTCHLMVVRRALLERIGGFRAGYEGAQDYDLVLRLIEQTARIHHLQKVLYHWRRIPESTAGTEGAKPWAHDAGKLALEDYVRRNGMDAEVLPGANPYLYRVRFAIRDQPLVSIVLPAVPDPAASGSDGRSACERTFATLAERTSYRRFEVVLPIEGDRAYGPALQIPRNLPIREVRIDAAPLPGGLRQPTRAAVHARGDHLLFLDWGMQAIDSEWLTALLEFSQQAAIGAVGAKLHYPDGTLKHIGILLGVKGIAAPAFHRHPRSSMGYWGTAIAARNYSAVSGACMMTRRRVYDEVGGFNDEMGGFADVDYCLRVTDAGYRIVFTPHAALVHSELSGSVSSAPVHEPARQLRARWGERLTRDPYLNANLSRASPDYEADLSSTASARA